MRALRAILAELDAKESELLSRLEEIRAARAQLLKVFHEPTEGPATAGPVASSLARLAGPQSGSQKRSISWTDEVYHVLAEHRRPMHLQEIIDEIERRGVEVRDRKKLRDTISGIVSRKARDSDTFSHVDKGTFGLLEWPVNAKISDASEATGTEALQDIVRQEPGLTSSEIVDRLEARLKEPASVAKNKRNSRITRVGQLYRDGIVQRVDNRHFPILEPAREANFDLLIHHP
jgi:hypothetical protein